MKFLLLSFILCLHIVAFSQDNDPVEVTPAMEKKIRQEVEKDVVKLRAELRQQKRSELAIEFALDTFRVADFVGKYLKKDYTTAGMTTSGYEAAKQYDSLLNKYYKRLLAKLQPEDKKILIAAQKAWLSYRDSETKLVSTLSKDEYSGGGTVQQLTDMSMYQELIKNRLFAICDHLSRISGEY